MDSRSLEISNHIFAVAATSAAQEALGKANTGCHGQRAGERIAFWATASPHQVSHLRILQRMSSDRFQPSLDKEKSEMKQPVLEGSWRSEGGGSVV